MARLVRDPRGGRLTDPRLIALGVPASASPR